MLTASERMWLDSQREAIRVAAANADVYTGRLIEILEKGPPRWWQFRERRRKARAAGLAEAWNELVYRTDIVVANFLNIHNVTAGDARGPSISEVFKLEDR